MTHDPHFPKFKMKKLISGVSFWLCYGSILQLCHYKETHDVLKFGRNSIRKSAKFLKKHRMNPSNKITMTTKVQPLVSLNPHQAIWKTKVLLTGKGSMRTYKNARGEGCVFNVELTDEDGTQMQATMFNEAARIFFDKLEIGKVYYISKGTIKVANKQFRTIHNDFEMTLNEYSQVEEAINESMLVPERNFNFVSIDQLGPHVDQKELVDVIGVVQHVSPTTSIRRKRDQQIIPKRDIRYIKCGTTKRFYAINKEVSSC